MGVRLLFSFLCVCVCSSSSSGGGCYVWWFL